MPASTGAFFRASSKPDGTLLLMGACWVYSVPRPSPTAPSCSWVRARSIPRLVQARRHPAAHGCVLGFFRASSKPDGILLLMGARLVWESSAT